MRKLAIVALLAILGIATVASAQTQVTVDPAAVNLGFMNVFDLGGVYQFSSGWGFNDLVFTYSGNTLTLAPNTIGDPDPYWYIGGGGPGAPGNKIMEANGYAQVDDGSLAGQNVQFSFYVASNTLTSAHTAKAFIRDFAPDFSTFNEATVPIAGPGFYTVSLNTVNDAARHVQYGFQMVGVNVWVTDVAQYGTVVIEPDQVVSTEESSFSRVKSLYN